MFNQVWKCFTLTLGGGSPLDQCHRRYYEVIIPTDEDSRLFKTIDYGNYFFKNFPHYEKLYVFI